MSKTIQYNVIRHNYESLQGKELPITEPKLNYTTIQCARSFNAKHACIIRYHAFLHYTKFRAFKGPIGDICMKEPRKTHPSEHVTTHEFHCKS